MKYPDSSNALTVPYTFKCENRVGISFAKKHLALLNAYDIDKSAPGTNSNFSKVEIQFVTGFSWNHFFEATDLLETFHKHFPNKTMIVYDLGLGRKQLKKLNDRPYVSVRRFQFENYPNYVKKNLFAYHWKPLIALEILQEFPAMIWADASIVFLNVSFLETVKKRINENQLYPTVLFLWAGHSNYRIPSKYCCFLLFISINGAKI